MATRRLFIGLMATTQVQKAITAHMARWGWPTSAQLTPPERMHLTLSFLGDVGAADETCLRLYLAGVLMPPICLKFTTVELFSSTLAVLRPETSGALERLHEEIAAIVDALKLRPDRKSWKPHITLARNALDATPPVEFPAIEFSAMHFSLVCSRPEWADRYEIVESWQAHQS